MTEQWTCSDTGRAIRGRAERLRAECNTSDNLAARHPMATLLALLSGLGGPISDSEVRAVERMLDGERL